MDYSTIEKEISDILNADQTFTIICTSQPLPDNPTTQITANTHKAVAIVSFIEEKYEKTKAIDIVAQPVKVTMRVYVESLYRFGELGVYPICDLVKAILTGRKLSVPGTVLMLANHTFIQYENNVWSHMVEFNYDSMRVQQITNPNPVVDTYPPGTEVLFDPNKVKSNEEIQVHRQGEDCGCGTDAVQ